MLNSKINKPSKEILLESNKENRYSLKHNGYHFVVEIFDSKDYSYLQVNFDALCRLHKHGIESQDVPKHIVKRAIIAYNNFFKEEQ